MARRRKAQEKDVITRLAGAGEDALHRLGDLPGGKAVLEAVAGVRERLDDVATKLRKLDPLERRVSAIEKRLDSLEPPKQTAARRATSSKASARRTATRSKPSSS
jgi:hypothetical protein